MRFLDASLKVSYIQWKYLILHKPVLDKSASTKATGQGLLRLSYLVKQLEGRW